MDRNEEELEDSLDAMSRAFASPGTSTSESARSGVEDGIRKGYCAFHNQRALAETLEKNGLVKKWDEIATFATLAASPSDAAPQRVPTAAGFSRKITEFLVAVRRASRDEIGSIETGRAASEKSLITDY